MQPEQKHKGISRIDSRNTHGWFVRVYNRDVTYSKLFSDKKNGGRAKALDMALEFRDQLESEVRAVSPGRRIVQRDKRNKSGVIGVCRTRKRNRNGTYSECYSVSWSPELNVKKCRTFSIQKYGEDTAFELACELRRQKEMDIYGETWVENSGKGKKKKKARTKVKSPKQK